MPRGLFQITRERDRVSKTEHAPWSLQVYIMWCPAATWPSRIAGDYIRVGDLNQRTVYIIRRWELWDSSALRLLKRIHEDVHSQRRTNNFLVMLYNSNHLFLVLSGNSLPYGSFHIKVIKLKFVMHNLHFLNYPPPLTSKGTNVAHYRVSEIIHIQMGCGSLQLSHTQRKLFQCRSNVFWECKLIWTTVIWRTKTLTNMIIVLTVLSQTQQCNKSNYAIKKSLQTFTVSVSQFNHLFHTLINLP